MTLSGTTSPILRRVALFRDLPEAELTDLARHMTRREFGRNELIFSQGDPGDGFYIVTEGRVRITRENASGNEVIMTLHEPGEYFGELALFDDEPRSASATAEERTGVLFLSRSVFRQFLEEHPRALYSCLQVIVRQLRRCTDLVDELALMDVRSRLARRLLSLGEAGVLQGPDGSFRLTQQHLASMTGATRESVNKHLNMLVDEGVVEVLRGRIRILNREALEDYAVGSL
jgi:CRP/FNR family transcriptional regulator